MELGEEAYLSYSLTMKFSKNWGNLKKLPGSLLIFSLLLLSGCGGISFISSKGSAHYGKDYLKSISQIKSKYREGHSEIALGELKRLKDSELGSAEKARKYNLIGVIYFSEDQFDLSIVNFEKALSFDHGDLGLKSQINLNRASTYYKMGFLPRSFTTLLLIDYSKLRRGEEKEYHHLSYVLAGKMGREDVALKSLIHYLGNISDLLELKEEDLWPKLKSLFGSLSSNERMRQLGEYESSNFLNIAFLAYLEIEKNHYSGKKDEAKKLLEWLKEHFSSFEEIKILVTNFEFRIENFAKLNNKAIGVVLPFDEKKAGFSNKALEGLNLAYKELYGSMSESGEAPVMYVENSHGTGVGGAYGVKKLIENHFVSIVIGGLFSDEALEEYLEARKHGVLFISLSPIYLPREQKDHLLIEIPGSVESQMSSLFEQKFLDKFGRKVAIIYPNDSKGMAYVNEFWKQAKTKDVEIVSLQSFEKNVTDYRDPVAKLLELKYKRERNEELELWTEIHKLQGRKSVRRLQNLPPQINFDWVYLPAFPHEVLQIIPAFSYFDAFRLTYVGEPSWRSKRLSRKTNRLGKLFFMSNNLSEKHKIFVSQFEKSYGKKPKLIETLANEALGIIGPILIEQEYKTRDELDMFIRSKNQLTGITGSWSFEDGLWVKSMTAFKVRRSSFDQVTYEEISETQVGSNPSKTN